LGIGEEHQQGVITFFSCSPTQVSYEIEELKQGAFTNVLLEALRIQGEGNCATVERFVNYLKIRVPQVTQRYKKYNQIPYVKIEPETKLHYILLPKFANLTDIALLRENALEAENEGDYDLAFQLWLRVNVAAGGSDIKAIKAFQRLANKQSQSSPPTQTASNQGSKAPSTPASSPSVTPEFKRDFISNKAPLAPPVKEVKEKTVELLSTKAIDYSELENLLKSQEWNKADKLTAKLMLKVANREKEGWLNEDSVKIFSCIDLQTIDQLWVHYSDGEFGFSVQKNWLKVGTETLKQVGLLYWGMGKYSYNFGKKLLVKEAEADTSETENNAQNLIDNIYQMPLMRYGGHFTGLIFRPCAVFLSNRLLDCNR